MHDNCDKEVFLWPSPMEVPRGPATMEKPNPCDGCGIRGHQRSVSEPARKKRRRTGVIDIDHTGGTLGGFVSKPVKSEPHAATAVKRQHIEAEHIKAEHIKAEHIKAERTAASLLYIIIVVGCMKRWWAGYIW